MCGTHKGSRLYIGPTHKVSNAKDSKKSRQTTGMPIKDGIMKMKSAERMNHRPTSCVSTLEVDRDLSQNR